MDLRDLLLGIEVGGDMSITSIAETTEVSSSYESEDMGNDDEEYLEGSPMQVLEYAESQRTAEKIKLTCIVKDLSSPTLVVDASKKESPTLAGKHECYFILRLLAHIYL
jgi:hypothetical protein